jgi:hypothetical protein
VGAGDDPVQIADFTNDPPEIIEGRSPQQQAANEGSISAITPGEANADYQKSLADQQEAYQAFNEGFVPTPDSGMMNIWYQQWQELVREGKQTPTIVEEGHNPEEE